MNDTRMSPGAAQASSGSGEEREFVSHDIPRAVRISEALRKFVDMVGRAGSWLFIPVVMVMSWTSYCERSVSSIG